MDSHGLRWIFRGLLWSVRWLPREPSSSSIPSLWTNTTSHTVMTAGCGPSTKETADTGGRWDNVGLLHDQYSEKSVITAVVFFLCFQVFLGNQEAYETKTNTFFPPVIGRFIRLHPISWYNKATVRMEFYGCELDGMLDVSKNTTKAKNRWLILHFCSDSSGCSVPLGMESRLIEDHHITASSTASSWYSGPWKASLARLNKQGTINAWQAKVS